MIRYSFAYDENRKLINIKDITEENSHQHKYYCISCGEELVPGLGASRKHHFAHKSETECNSETYLHRLAKMRIREAFLSRKSFQATYLQNSQCKDYDQCPFSAGEQCSEPKVTTINLRFYYDTCQEEQTVTVNGQNYIADLLLTDSTGRITSPVLIEIWVSHACTPEKIASGLRIIEVPVCSEDDIERILTQGITEQFELYEEEDGHFYRMLETGPTGIQFHNFKRDFKSEKTLKRGQITRFILFKKGSSFVPPIDEPLSCEYLNKRYSPYSAIELNIPQFYLEDPNPYQCGLVYLLNRGLDIRNCMLCKYYHGYADSYSMEPCCGLSRKYGTPYSQKQEEARTCQYYTLNQPLVTRVTETIKDMKITEVKK